MKRPSLRGGIWLVCVAALVVPPGQHVYAEQIAARQVMEAIERGKRSLLNAQEADGSWSGAAPQHKIGATSLALLALLNTGLTVADPEIQRGLDWLRKQKPVLTYDISLMIQTLAAARDGDVDLPCVTDLVERLEESQIVRGTQAGSWTYNKAGRGGDNGDRSNAQFAVLALREAREMGIPVGFGVWRAARNHWLGSQSSDGGWHYSRAGKGAQSTGSMTVAGIATLVITETMLKAEENDLDGDGHPVCCSDLGFDRPLENACRWLGNNFAVTRNPGGGAWLLYYLYGLERAGRFSGRRFFVNGRGQKHDWYQEGTDYLLLRQNRADGTWRDSGTGENNAIIGTSFALMFLSKGLAPVLINKLEYGIRDAKKEVIGNDWNRHKDDVRNLTQLVSGLPKYPRLLSWQTVDIGQASLADLMQAPILFLSGSQAPQISPAEVALLKDYVLQGGFVLADNNCKSRAFDEGFRDLVRQIYPPPEAQLKKLTAAHPVFRSEFNLLDESTGEPTVELWGVDIGCRTSIMYSPDDLSCLWDKWTSFEVPRRTPEFVSPVTSATRAGVNVVAYATGRKILNKLERQDEAQVKAGPDKVERDLLQISKIRYTGDWDAAPRALKNLLVALNATAGLAVSPRQRDLTLLDQNLFRYPIAYMHGRHDFALGKNEQDRLREFIQQGGFLFADACCGRPEFDDSFRRLMRQVFSEQALKRIPPNHELFSGKVGHDLKTVKLRQPDRDNADANVTFSVREIEPFLEGIEVNGRFVVVYSKYDISCALEGEPSPSCTGYVHADAVRIGVNVITYALLQ